MKKNTLKLLLLIVPIITQSCGLLGDEDDFSCDKNAPYKRGGKDVCANAIVREYKQNIDDPSEFMKIGFVSGTGSFDVTLNTTEIEMDTYNYPGEVNLWFAQINKGGSGTLTITNIDRANKTISGEYNLTAEGASNFQAYQYEVVGTFTALPF